MLCLVLALALGDFIDVLPGGDPQDGVIEFTAKWCVPCKVQRTRLAATGATVYVVDIDECPALAKRYKVTTLPTLIVVKAGKVVRRHVGLCPVSTLRSLLRQE